MKRILKFIGFIFGFLIILSIYALTEVKLNIFIRRGSRDGPAGSDLSMAVRLKRRGFFSRRIAQIG
jgi:hypothetical protein